MSEEPGSFVYGRHFALLLGLAVMLLAVAGRLPPHGATARFALYGALYSSALALCVRGPVAVGRRLLFTALGTLVSAANAMLGLEAVHFQLGVPVALGHSLILICCACLGAAVYATLVRAFWRPTLTLAALLAASAACTLAVQGVLALHLELQSGGAWVAVSWWFAFSLALCYHDRPRIAVPG